jgi:methylated-DNA-[protein]-cysteine S-methyltransferase
MPHLAVASPVGTLTLTEENERLLRLDWNGSPGGEETPLLREARRQLEAYFARRLRTFDLPLALAGTPFRRAVWAAMQRIPYGETRSYGELAMELGSAPRAIGGACGKNPIPIIVPCHRILASGRRLGGYSSGSGGASKRFLLTIEGAALAAAA